MARAEHGRRKLNDSLKEGRKEGRKEGQPRNFRQNRCAHRAFFLTEEERTRFVDRLWRVARFSGVEVLAYCIMSNHFHLLVYVPEPPPLSDEDLLARIRVFYTGERLSEILRDWKRIVQSKDDAGRIRFRERFLRRMHDVSAFMKTLKQNSTVSYNCRSAHAGTMWEARFRAREYLPDERCALMNVAAYIDRNPVKAKMVPCPDEYAWCGFAAACRGDSRCIDGYRFIYSFAPLAWSQIREMHEKSIRLVLKELDDECLSGPARKGLSVDEEKMQKARQKTFEQVEESVPRMVPRLLARGSNKVAADILGLLKDGPKSPSELREALGLSSANYLTARYLTPLARAGFIGAVGAESRHSPQRKYGLLPKGRTTVG